VSFLAGALIRLMSTFVIGHEDDEEINDPNIAQTFDYKTMVV
jgi:hypothetical protein